MYLEVPAPGPGVTCHVAAAPPVKRAAPEPEDFLCPIGLEVMVEPVTILRTGQSYDALNLKTWFAAGGDCCPLTGVKLDFSGGPVYQPNPELKRQIQGWAALRGVDLTVLQPVETPRSSAVASPPSNRRRQRWQRVCHDVKRLGRILKDNLRSPGGHDSSMQSRV